MFNTLTAKDKDEIIGLQFKDGTIEFGASALRRWLKGEPAVLHSRAIFKMMGALDLGEKWKDVAINAKTLFKRSEYKDLITRAYNNHL